MKFVMEFEAVRDTDGEAEMDDDQFAKSIEGEAVNALLDLGFTEVSFEVKN